MTDPQERMLPAHILRNVAYPDFDRIVEQCKRILERKYLEYGNSWVGFTDGKFWKKRLNGEINEIWKAKSPEECRKEICDTVNILAMMYANAGDESD